jgi:peroxidase
VLLNSTKNNTAEKDAKPNHTLDAFDVIDTIKEKLEKKCPRTVSCADILAIAARDAVSLVRNQAAPFPPSRERVDSGRMKAG